MKMTIANLRPYDVVKNCTQKRKGDEELKPTLTALTYTYKTSRGYTYLGMGSILDWHSLLVSPITSIVHCLYVHSGPTLTKKENERECITGNLYNSNPYDNEQHDKYRVTCYRTYQKLHSPR